MYHQSVVRSLRGEGKLSPSSGARILDDGRSVDTGSVRRRNRDGSVVRFLLGFVIVVAVTAAVWPFIPRRFEAPATIVLHLSMQDVSAGGNVSSQLPDENAIQSELDFIASPDITQAVVRGHDLINDPEFSHDGGWIASFIHKFRTVPWVGRFLPPPAEVGEADVRRHLESHLQLSRDRRSYTVKFGYWSNDPLKATALTQSLLDAYVEMQLRHKRQTIEYQSARMGDRVAILRTNAERSEALVRAFLDKSGLIDAGAQVSLEHQLATLSTELAQVRAHAIEADTRSRTLTEMKAAGTLENAPEILASPSIRRFKEAMASAMAKPSVWAPEARELNQQIDSESDRVVSGAAAEAHSLHMREGLLQTALEAISTELTARRRAEQRLEDLRREAAADRTVLDDAVMRLKGQTARAGGVVADIDIIARPEPRGRPTSPNPLLALLGTLVAGCAAGFALSRWWVWLRAPAAIVSSEVSDTSDQQWTQVPEAYVQRALSSKAP